MSSTTQTTTLFSPYTMGALQLANRMVMAPLTRSRAGKGDVQGSLNATYYGQRASAGLIISEGTQISQQGKGYAFTPGIYTEEQVAGWKLATDAVHAKGGKIVAQLWHVGRISHPDLQKDGALPVGPSAIKPEGQAFTETGFKPLVTPHALEPDEIKAILVDYAHAAACALKAGFDGVEIHAANGYLIDQFLRDSTNHRTDQYGGSIANRARLMEEVVQVVTEVCGADRTGIRLSPVTPVNDITDSNPQAVFDHAVAVLNRYNLAFLHVVEGATGGARDVDPSFDFLRLRQAFNGSYIANNGYDLALAEQALAEDRADLIAFGRPFIANPDLVERFKAGAPLNALDGSTLYGGDAKGYTDYPAL